MKLFNQLAHSVNAVEVFRFQIVNTDCYVKFGVDLGNKRNDIERIENSVTDQCGFRFKVNLRVKIL